MVIFAIIYFKNMIYRWLLIVIVISSLSSCDGFFSNKTKKNTVVSKTEPIDFKNVDAYPLLPECEQFSSRELQQNCFYRFFSKRIEVALSKQHITLPNTIKIDTIKTTITINSTGVVSVKSIHLEDTVDNKIIRDAITNSINSLPKMKPAIKAGIPVTTEFVLPIVLSSSSN